MPTKSIHQGNTQEESVDTFPCDPPTPSVGMKGLRTSDYVAVDQPPAISGLVQLFALDVRAAGIAIIVDALVFGSDTLSLGLLFPVGLIAAGALGMIVYRIQRKWYGDDHGSALIKALTIGLLTAIPVPITPLLAIPGGCIGLLQRFRRK